MYQNAVPGRTFIGNLKRGSDLIDSLTAFCSAHAVTCGTFTLIGAVQRLAVAYYDQSLKKYDPPHALDQRLEVVSCSGNISLKNNDIFLHAHIICADKGCHAFGGHLMPGTTVFAAEFCIRELKSKPLKRKKDRSTGLFLWK